MRIWWWSYLIHALVWSALAVAALYVGLVAYLPFLVLAFVVSSPVSALLVLTIGFVALLFWFILGIQLSKKSKSAVLRAFPHAVIATLGIVCLDVVGAINFPFRI